MGALEAVGGYTLLDVVGRGEPLAGAADGADVVVLAVPDHAVAAVAAAVEPATGTVVMHLSGSLGLDVLAPHARRASLHPLVPLPNPTVGSVRLRTGVTFAVAGDPTARSVAESLGGRPVTVDDGDRATYHAAATVAANHVVALLGQVERIAGSVDIPLDAFTGLVLAAVEDALSMGPRAALTGPAARGDWTTVDRHRRVVAGMPDGRSELGAYDAMVALARRLAVERCGAGDSVVSGPDRHGALLPDGGLPDGGLPDGGTPDSGLPDGGLPDSGTRGEVTLAAAGYPS